MGLSLARPFKTFWPLLILSFALVGAGCSGTLSAIRKVTGEQARVERQLADLRKDYQKRVEEKGLEVSTAKDAQLAAKDGQMKTAAGSFYGQDVLFKSILAPTRTDLITHNLALEGWAALGSIMPDYATMQKINDRLRDELDETKTSLADLQRNHLAAMAESQKQADAARLAQERVVALEKERAALESDFLKRLDEKQGELVDLTSKLASLEKERANDRAALQAAKMKLSMVAGGLALLFVAGAVYSPVLKRECAIMAAICGGVSVGIWYVAPWHVAVAAAVTGAGIVIWVVKKHRNEERLSDSLVLGLQRVKEQSSETWAKVSPTLKDQMGRYVKRNGKTVVEPDHTLEALVDQKLAEYEQLGPPPSTPITTP